MQEGASAAFVVYSPPGLPRPPPARFCLQTAVFLFSPDTLD